MHLGFDPAPAMVAGPSSPQHMSFSLVLKKSSIAVTTDYDVKIVEVDAPLTIAMKNVIGRPVLDIGVDARGACDPWSLVLPN